MIISKGNILFRRLGVLLVGTAVLAAAVSLVSCGAGRGSGLKRYDLFTIPLGTLPGELDWFYRDGFRMAGTADIQSRDGLIHISGGETGKVMVFNSYGDLLALVYDPSRNPAPAEAEEGESVASVSSWTLRDPRTIAAFDGGFLVDDGVGRDRRVIDEGMGVVYDRVVLRFDQYGKYLGHLGREGLGGSPFPYVSSLDVREDGGMVVTCRTPDAWMSYWYDKSGRSITTVMIRENQLPGREDGGRAAVYAIRPDPVERSLHIRLDVYPEEGGGRPEARLYTLDLTTLEYGEPLVLAYAEGRPDEGIPAVPPEYLGTTIGGLHMLIAPDGTDSYRMVLIDGEGRTVQSRRLRIDPTANVYRRFRLQNDGLLTGIFFGPVEAFVCWWRVDKLVGGE